MRIRGVVVVAAAVMVAALVDTAVFADQLPAQSDGTLLPADRCPDRQSMLAFSKSEYAQDVVADFADLVYYPAEAAQAGEAGKVVMCVHLNRRGTVSEAYIMSSAGHPMLDGAALLAVGALQVQQRASVGALLPDHMQDAWMTLPVDFDRLAGVKDTQPAPTPGACARRAAGEPAEAVAAGSPGSSGPMFVDDRNNTDELQNFYDRIHSGISHELHFPREAGRAGQKGSNTVCILIDRQAHILDAAILHTSGFPQLDGAILTGVGRAQLNARFAPLPENVIPKVSQLVFTFSVNWIPRPDVNPDSIER